MVFLIHRPVVFENKLVFPPGRLSILPDVCIGSVFGLLSPSDRGRLKQAAERTKAHLKSTTERHSEQHMAGGFIHFPLHSAFFQLADLYLWNFNCNYNVNKC